MEVDSHQEPNHEASLKAKQLQEAPKVNGFDHSNLSVGSSTKSPEKSLQKKKKKKAKALSLSDDDKSNGNSEVQII